MSDLTIKSGQGDYTVSFGSSLKELTASLLAVPNALFLIDRNIQKFFGKELEVLWTSRPTHWVDASEDEKTLDGAARALTFFQENNAAKQTVIVAIGGGVIQDITTFCAHVYYRGIKWVYVPTTLLGMADSCIGAKASINFNQYKNQLGAFHAPAQVKIEEAFLATLSDTEIRSGYGEIVKLHLTGSRAQYEQLKADVGRDGLRGPHLAKAIRTSLEIKQRVIEIDEYEKDLRRILNFGHTFGHALESITHHAIPHGLAVAWGVDLVNWISVKAGLLSEADFQDIHAFLARHYSWQLPKAFSATELIAASRRDKKVASGRINLILLKEPGDLRIVSRAFDQELEAAVIDYCTRHSIVTVA